MKINSRKIKVITLISIILLMGMVLGATTEVNHIVKGEEVEVFETLSQVTVSINASKDANVYNGSPNSNVGHGEEMSLRNRYGSGTTDHYGADVLIYFNLSSIPPESVIISANMYLYYHRYHDNNPAGRVMSVYKNQAEWNESNVTYNNAPSFSSVQTATGTVPSSTGNWMQINVLNDVKEFSNRSHENHGWRIIDGVKWGMANIPISYYRTKEYGSFIPYIQITYEPSEYPYVKTNKATNITDSSASLNGYLEWDGDKDCDVWFEWGPTESMVYETSKITGKRSPLSFHINISSLSSGQLYYYRAVSENTNGKRYGENLTFLTKPKPPTNFKANQYNETQLNLVWTKGEGANYTYIERNQTGVTSWNKGDGIEIYNGTGTSYGDGGLEYDTMYYYQAWSYAEWENAVKLYWWSEHVKAENITRYPDAIVETKDPTGIGTTNATLQGLLVYDGHIPCNVSFEWGKTLSFGNWTTEEQKTTGQTFSFNLQSLDPGTVYYYRAVVNNSRGTYYGENKTFLTIPNPPTSLQLDINPTGFDITWVKAIPSNNTIIRWKEGSYPTNMNDGTLLYNNTGTFTTHTGLEVEKTYYYRAWSYVSHDSLYQYSTEYAQANKLMISEPTVITNDPTAIGTNSATLNGYLSEDGALLCDVSFEWGNTISLGYWTTEQQKSKGEHFSSTIMGLDPGEVCYYRAVANNTEGTSLGEIKTFLTKPQPPTGFNANKFNYEQINLTWSKGTGAVYTYIERNTTSTWDRGEGIQIYNGTGSMYNDDGLNYGTRYYYQAWSYVEKNSMNQYSTYVTSNDITDFVYKPTVQTLIYDNLVETSIKLRGYLANDGDAPCSVWFEYGKTTPLTMETSKETDVTSGTYFDFNLVGLDPGALYYYRAVAENNNGTSYGTTFAFITKPYAPTNLEADAYSSSVINITWTKGIGANNTRVERNTIGSWSRGEGQLIYDGVNEYYNDVGLDENKTYFYQAWSKSVWMEATQFSDNYASTNEKTMHKPNVTKTIPEHMEKGVPIAIGQLRATLIDKEGRTIDWTIQTVPNVGSNSGSSNSGEDAICPIATLTYGQKYIWYVNLTAGNDYESYRFNFTANNPPEIYGEFPADNARHVDVNIPLINVTIYDADDDYLHWTIETHPDIGSESRSGESSGDKMCLVSGMQYNTTYTWWVNATDGKVWTNKTYTFSTNYFPVLYDIYPEHNAVVFPKPTCSIHVSDEDGDVVTVKFYENTTGSWVLQKTQYVDTSTQSYASFKYDNASQGNTFYWWKVIVDDDYDGIVEEIYRFRTNNPMIIYDEYPIDKSVNVRVETNQLNITIDNPDGQPFNWTITTSPDIGNASGTLEANGTKVCVIAGLQYGTTYQWTVHAEDGEDQNTVTFEFKTASKPELKLIHPENNSYTRITPTCTVEVKDVDGGQGILRFYENTTGDWVLQKEEIFELSNTWVQKSFKYTNATVYEQKYWWKVRITDNVGYYEEKILAFTPTNLLPYIENPHPTNGSTDVSLNLFYLFIELHDFESDPINWTIETSPDIGSNSQDNDINGTKICHISGLQPNTVYTWYVNATAGSAEYNRKYFTFKTTENPVIYDEKPANNSETNVRPICEITVDDPDGGFVIVSFYENTTGDWILQKEEFVDVNEGAKKVTWNRYENATVVNKTYWWKVIVDDMGGGIVENIYNFKTDHSPIIFNEYPVHESYGISKDISILTVTIEDPQGLPLDWTIETYPDIGSSSGTGEGNGTKSCSIAGMEIGETYTWYVNATNGDKTTRETFTFDINKAPIMISTTHTQIPIPIKPTIELFFYDPDLDDVTVKIYENTTGDWVLQETYIRNYNSYVVMFTYENATLYETEYWFKVNLSDGKGGYFEEIYNFTTTVNLPPRILNPEPANNSINVRPGTNALRVTIEDDEDLFNWTIETSPYIGFESRTEESSGIKLCMVSGLGIDTIYTWYVNVTDGTSWTNKTYTFRTGYNDPIVIENPSIENWTSNLNLVQPPLHIDIYDPDGDPIHWTIETYPDIGSSYGGDDVNGTKFCSISQLKQGTTYIWYVNATDGYQWTRKYYYFTTSQPPIILDVYPANNSEGAGISPICYVVLDDPDETYDQIDVYWYQWKNGDWVFKQLNENLTNLPDTVSWKYDEATDPAKVYYWKIVAIDHKGASVTGIFNFRPTANEPPQLHFPFPAHGQTNVDVSLNQLTVEVSDREGDLVNWIITTNPYIGTNYSLAYEPGTLYCPVTNLQYGTTYYWHVNTTDEVGSGQWTNATYWFTTSFLPQVTNEKPKNNERAYIQPICSIDVYDGDGGTLNVKFYENTTGDWVLQKEVDVSAKPKNTVTWHYYNASVFGETYYWRINVSDPQGHYVDNIYSFTANKPPIISSPNPSNNSVNIAMATALLEVYIEDPEGDPIDWTITTSPYVGSSFGIAEVNGTKNVAVFNLQPGTVYTWYITATDGVSEVSEEYTFRTSFYPEVLLIIPANNEENVRLQPRINVTVFDYDGGNVEVRFQENTTGSWVLRHTAIVDATTPANVTWDRYLNANKYNTWYWWRILVNDVEGNTITRTYKFKTVPNTPPWVTNEIPQHESINIDLSTNTLTVDLEDAEGHLMNWTIETYPNVGSASGNGYGNGTVSCSIPGLVSDTTYTWYVNVTDGLHWTRKVYTFNTTRRPIISNPLPEHNSVVKRRPICSVDVFDPDGDIVDVEFYREEGASWILMQTNESVNASSTVRIVWDKYMDANVYSTNYRWRVIVNDEKNSTSEAIFNFRTVDNNHPIILSTDPEHNVVGISVYKENVSVDVTDIEGHLMNITISSAYLNTAIYENVGNGTYIATPTQRFPYNRKIDWQVRINDGYNWTNASFHFYTEFDLIPPEIHYVNVTPDRAKKNEIIVIESKVTDNDEVDFVEVVFPSLGLRYPMFEKGNDIYGLEVDFTVLGNYLFYIYAEDVWGNANMSDYYSFTIVAKEIMIDLHTIEYAQKNSPNKMFMSITDSYYSNQIEGIADNISCYIANKQGYVLMNGSNPDEIAPGLYEKEFTIANKSGSFISWVLVDYKGSTYMQASVFEVKYFAYENISYMSDRLSDLVALSYWVSVNSSLEIIEHMHPTHQMTENLSVSMEKTGLLASLEKTVMSALFSWVFMALIILVVFVLSTWIYGRKKGADIAMKVANIPSTIAGYLTFGRLNKKEKKK